MIYFMTAFFLWFNTAPEFWWAGFITVCLVEMFIWFVNHENC